MRMKCLARRHTDSHGIMYLAMTIGVPDGAWGGGGGGGGAAAPLPSKRKSSQILWKFKEIGSIDDLYTVGFFSSNLICFFLFFVSSCGWEVRIFLLLLISYFGYKAWTAIPTSPPHKTTTTTIQNKTNKTKPNFGLVHPWPWQLLWLC